MRLRCERAFLKKLEGGCQLPCGITTVLADGVLKTAGALFAIEGHEWVEQKLEGPADYPEDVGETLADLILEKGGDKILEQIKKSARHEALHEKKKEERSLPEIE